MNYPFEFLIKDIVLAQSWGVMILSKKSKKKIPFIISMSIKLNIVSIANTNSSGLFHEK